MLCLIWLAHHGALTWECLGPRSVLLSLNHQTRPSIQGIQSSDLPKQLAVPTSWELELDGLWSPFLLNSFCDSLIPRSHFQLLFRNVFHSLSSRAPKNIFKIIPTSFLYLKYWPQMRQPRHWEVVSWLNCFQLSHYLQRSWDLLLSMHFLSRQKERLVF